MKSLVLAEKPSVGKEIARVLGCNHSKNGYAEGPKYIVTWAYGHLVTLADPEVYDKKYANWHLEDLPIIPDHLKKVVIGKTSRQFSVVKQLATRNDVNEIIIATDAGREGELVARWTLDKLKNKKPIKRLWISSVTDKAIRQGFQNLKPGAMYIPLYHAAIARAEGDWIVGINATRALTTKYNTQLSCGRVQTPTLAMIDMREESIRQFKPQKFYGIKASYQGKQFDWIDQKGQKHSYQKNIVQDTLDQMGKTGVIQSVEKKEKAKQSELLYDLTQLQRDAHQRFGFSPKQTLNIMQKLYEQHKALTYPRTDSRYLTSDMFETLDERLKAIQGEPYRKVAYQLVKAGVKHSKHYINDQKVSDHHAIIPTEEIVNPSSMSFEERKIYDLVVKRFLEVLLPTYTYEETKVTVSLGKATLIHKGHQTVDLGWKILSESEASRTQQTLWKKGQSIDFQAIEMTSGETQPPNRFNEASLLAAMENPGKYMDGSDELKKILSETGGLGTVATRADIIEKLFNTQVIEKKGNSIYLTKKGTQLLRVAPKALNHLS